MTPSEKRSRSNYSGMHKARMARRAACIGLLLLLAPGPSWAKKKKAVPLTPQEAFAQKIAGIAQQLVGMHLDESAPIDAQIQKLVLDHMQEWLAQHPPSDKPTPIPYSVDVRRELESIFSAVRFPVYVWPATFSEPWKDHLLIGVGYTLGWKSFDRVNTLAIFDRAQGNVKLAATTNFVPRVDLHYEFLPAPPSGEFRFLAYGTRLGKSHPRLSAQLYSFDGQALTSSWKTEDVYDGKLDVENGQVVINYMKEDEFVEAATHKSVPPRYQAVYKVAPGGLELVTDQQIAAQGQ